MQKVLAIGYSQSGQLDDLLDIFLEPFTDYEIDRVKIRPVDPFPFPWTGKAFFDLMPETVLEVPVELEPFEYRYSSYDLIIFAYSPWYLSPSLPTTSLLKDGRFRSLLKDTPVVTLIGARNMWLNAQESVKTHLQGAGARLISNIVFVDRNPNLLSVVTILDWMMTGKKRRLWNIFPLPGVSEKDMDSADSYGELVVQAVQQNETAKLQQRIIEAGGVFVKTNLLFIELRAKRLFRIWANIIRKKGTTPAKRARWVRIFKYYLLVALFAVSPVVLLFYNLLVRPFTRGLIKRQKAYFCEVEN